MVKTIVMIISLLNGVPDGTPMIKESVGLFCEVEFQAIMNANKMLTLVDPKRSYTAVCHSTLVTVPEEKPEEKEASN